MSGGEPSIFQRGNEGVERFPDTHVPIAMLDEHLMQGHSIDEFLAMYPRVKRADVQALLLSRADSADVYILFLDIVGSSKLAPAEQLSVSSELNSIVSNTESFRAATDQNNLVCRPVGDGMALVFFSGIDAPFQCAMEIDRAIRPHPTLKLRMGIHCGPGHVVRDINGRIDIVGDAMIRAKRIMDVGDSGHVLLSDTAAQALESFPEHTAKIRLLGTAEGKHGLSLVVWSLVAPGLGNPRPPKAIVDHLIDRFSENETANRRGKSSWTWIALGVTILTVVASYVFRLDDLWTPATTRLIQYALLGLVALFAYLSTRR
ncbi:MAG: hypothetical protein HONBIEJF_02374 [Fimbriimonadaceae bacterium]|nr:hypothetical protein [Fimbriimonadaceae bacterium]